MCEIIRDYWPTKEWRICSPKDVDMDWNILREADTYIEKNMPNVNSFVLVRNGYIVFEKYYNGRCKDILNPVMSVTKSVISLLIGIAIHQEFIESVDQKVVQYFPELIIDATNYMSFELTIRHLLTMTSGIQWRTASRGREYMLDRMCRSKNWAEFILGLPVQKNTFGKFQYNSGNSHLLSAIITTATGLNAQSFLNKYILNILGIKEIYSSSLGYAGFNGIDSVFERMGEEQWVKDPQGHNMGGLGLSLSTRDMAKIGYLYLNNGFWEKQFLVSDSWVSDSFKAYNGGDYGYHWWIKCFKGYNAYCAIGFGGQYIIVVPQYDIVVVVTSDVNQAAVNSKDPISILDKYIIKSIQ